MTLLKKALLYSSLATALCMAHTASASTITFNNLNGSNTTTFTSYTEAGYTVTSLTGDFLNGQGFGHPVPDLFAEVGTSSVLITKNDGGNFFFGDFDAASNGGNTIYNVIGILSGSNLYDVTGTIPTGSIFSVVDPAQQLVLVSSVIIRYSVGGSSANLDNIDLTAPPPPVAVTPEPSSLILLATGAFGMLGAASRRFRKA